MAEGEGKGGEERADEVEVGECPPESECPAKQDLI